MAAVVGAAQGDPAARAYVEGIYPQMQAGGEEWQRTADAFRRIIAGERDVEQLRGELNFMGYVIVRSILVQLGGAATLGLIPVE